MAYPPCSPKLVPLSSANSPQTLGMLPHLHTAMQLAYCIYTAALKQKQFYLFYFNGLHKCQQNINKDIGILLSKVSLLGQWKNGKTVAKTMIFTSNVKCSNWQWYRNFSLSTRWKSNITNCNLIYICTLYSLNSKCCFFRE